MINGKQEDTRDLVRQTIFVVAILAALLLSSRFSRAQVQDLVEAPVDDHVENPVQDQANGDVQDQANGDVQTRTNGDIQDQLADQAQERNPIQKLPQVQIQPPTIKRPPLPKSDVALQWSVAAEKNHACQAIQDRDFYRPLVLGLQPGLFARPWQLQLRLSHKRRQDPPVEIYVESLERENGKRNILARRINLFDARRQGTHLLNFEFPFTGTVPAIGDYREISVAVSVYTAAHKKYSFVNNIYVLAKKDSLRVYDFNRSCVKSLPPMIMGDVIKAPPGGIYAQDVLHEDLIDVESGGIVTDMSRYLSVGYYVANNAEIAVTSGMPTFAYSFTPADTTIKNDRHELKTQVTFRFHENEVGYLVANHAQQRSPYQDLRFDVCGRLERMKPLWKWQEKILPSFGFLVLAANEEGRMNLMEEKLKQYPHYNTCKKEDL